MGQNKAHLYRNQQWIELSSCIKSNTFWEKIRLYCRHLASLFVYTKEKMRKEKKKFPVGIYERLWFVHLHCPGWPRTHCAALTAQELTDNSLSLKPLAPAMKVSFVFQTWDLTDQKTSAQDSGAGNEYLKGCTTVGTTSSACRMALKTLAMRAREREFGSQNPQQERPHSWKPFLDLPTCAPWHACTHRHMSCTHVCEIIIYNKTNIKTWNIPFQMTTKSVYHHSNVPRKK